ncbi:hypothetical protein M3Y94_00920700 [Aphelenchoides besseyi]|nr:hypothetical protein M3Y94_00920700 [Aphelenchoides besseyi]KAI6223192.1 hypothetical protein M3Y95_00863400 [Aphelenchoides besseyi]
MFGGWKKIASLLAIAFELSILIDMLMADVSITKDFDQLLGLPSKKLKFTGFWGEKKATINMIVGECKLIIVVDNETTEFTPQIVKINEQNIQPCYIDESLEFKGGNVKGNAISCEATCDPKFVPSADSSEELIRVKITQLPKDCNITANAARISPGNPKKTDWTVPIIIIAVAVTALILLSIASSLVHKFWWKKRHERKADDANPAGPTITSQEVSRDAKPEPVIVKNENVDHAKGNTKPSAELAVQAAKPIQAVAIQKPTAVKNQLPNR